MILALDYDGTYTLDPGFWLKVIDEAQSRGNKVVCVTMRHPAEADSMCKNLLAKVEVIFTGRRAKAGFINADVWIDDSPHYIFRDG